MSKFLIVSFTLSQVWVLSYAIPDQTSDDEKKGKGHEQITDFLTVKSVKEKHLHSDETRDQDQDTIENDDQWRILNDVSPVPPREEKTRQQLREVIQQSDAKVFEEEYIALHKDEDGLVDHERYTRWPKLEGKMEEGLSAVCEKFLNIIPLTSKLEFEDIIYLHTDIPMIMRVRILKCKLEQYTCRLLESGDENCMYSAIKLNNAIVIYIKSKICEKKEPINIPMLVHDTHETISSVLRGKNKDLVQESKLKLSTGIKEIKCEEEDIQIISNAMAGKNKELTQIHNLELSTGIKKSKCEEEESQLTSKVVARKNKEPAQIPKLRNSSRIKAIKNKKDKISDWVVVKEKPVLYITAEQSNQDNIKEVQVNPSDIDGLHGRKYKPVKNFYK